jgi:hypothetical protein
MRKDKILCFTFSSEKFLPLADLCMKSFKHFHPDIEMRLIGPEIVEKYRSDPYFFAKIPPFFTKKWLRDYDLVLALNADSIITGPLDEIFDNETFDVGVVYNNNRTDRPVSVFNIPPSVYVNAGFVAVRNREFSKVWWEICNRYVFNTLRYMEQDVLNILVNYSNFNVTNFDDGNRWYGAVNRGEWHRFVVEDGKLICPADLGYNQQAKQICAIHAAGGDTIKWDWSRQFQPEVVKYLQEITK